MTMDRASLESLARALQEGSPHPPTDQERNLIISALKALITAQDLIARQALLLRSHEEDSEITERACAHAMSRISGVVSGRPPDAGYDSKAAAAARERLLREVREAENGKGVLVAALRFAAVVAGLAV